MSNDGIKGYFDFSVTGADKVAALEARLTEVERHLGGSLPAAAAKATAATDRVAHAQHVGGEKAARYITTAGALTGGLQRLGVQNDLVARSFGTFGDLLYGAAGPAGAIMVAVGAVGALAAKFYEMAGEQERASKAMEAGIDVMLRYRALSDSTGSIASVLLLRTEADLVKQRAAAEARLEQIQGSVSQTIGMNVSKPNFFEWISNPMAAMGKVGAGSILGKMREEAVALLGTIGAVDAKLAKIYGEPAGTGGSTGGAAAERAGGAAGRSGPGRFGLSDLWMLGEESGGARKPMSGPMGAEALGKEATDVYETIAAASRSAAESQAIDLEALLSTHQRVYGAMLGATQSTQRAASLFVQRAIEGENVSRLKGLTVARYVASGALAAVLQGMAKEAEERAGMEAIHAIAAAASGNFGSAAMHGAAAAGYGALAGVASGLAAGMQSTAQRQFDRETRSVDAMSGNSGGVGGTSSASNPGVRVAASGASVGTINYNFIVTYNGATVYGDGGTRDWFARELVPLINEGISTGAISRN